MFDGVWLPTSGFFLFSVRRSIENNARTWFFDLYDCYLTQSGCTVLCCISPLAAPHECLHLSYTGDFRTVSQCAWRESSIVNILAAFAFLLFILSHLRRRRVAISQSFVEGQLKCRHIMRNMNSQPGIMDALLTTRLATRRSQL